MKKTYENPMLQVVSIKNNVIATSGEPQLFNVEYNPATSGVLAPGQRDINSWDEGY